MEKRSYMSKSRAIRAPLQPDVQKHILPIYEDLSKYDLLERCLGGHTQNANGSFNSTVWRGLTLKHLHCGLKIIEIAAYLAAGLFKEGYASILKVIHALQLEIKMHAKNFADNSDQRRMQRKEWGSLLETKKVRKARREQLIEAYQFYEKAEGLSYGPGIFIQVHVSRFGVKYF